MTLLYLLSELKAHTQYKKLVCANCVSRGRSGVNAYKFYGTSTFPKLFQVSVRLFVALYRVFQKELYNFESV
jgi:hypothetical protein